MELITANGADFQAITDKARETVMACRARVEAMRAQRNVMADAGQSTVIELEVMNVVMQVTLQAASQELGVPRPALVPAMALAAGMITTADLPRTKNGEEVSVKVVEAFMDTFVVGLQTGLQVRKPR